MIIKNVGKNQIEIHNKEKDTTILQSYNTVVAAKISGKWYKTEQFYSRTTSKHITQFFNGFDDAIVKPQEFFDNLMED